MKKSQDPNRIGLAEKNYLYVATSQLAHAGKGLFTSIEIYKDEIIAVFKGELLSDIQAAARAGKGKDHYFIAMPDGTIMDSMKTACFAKYANDGTAVVNSAVKNNGRIALDDAGRVCIIATRKIKSGEEIFCSYGKRYWKKHLLLLKSDDSNAGVDVNQLADI